MAKENSLLLQNESGAALVIALIILVVLTLISLSSSITSISEIKLSGNKRGSTDAFYTADGGIETTVANPDNFIAERYTAIQDTGGLSPDILSQGVDTMLTQTVNSKGFRHEFAPDVAFTSPPTIVIYHQTTTAIPKGGFGPGEYQYYIIRSTATESLGSRSELITTAFRIMPPE